MGGAAGCAGDFVIVTGASSGFFDRAANLVGSIHHWAPKIKIIFYDLGLSPVQVWVGVLVGAAGWVGWMRGWVVGWVHGCACGWVGCACVPASPCVCTTAIEC